MVFHQFRAIALLVLELLDLMRNCYSNCRQYCFGLLGLISEVLMLELRESYMTASEIPCMWDLRTL